jgi:hypothetical protein
LVLCSWIDRHRNSNDFGVLDASDKDKHAVVVPRSAPDLAGSDNSIGEIAEPLLTSGS